VHPPFDKRVDESANQEDKMKELRFGEIHSPSLRSAARVILLLTVLAGTVAGQETGNATEPDNRQKSVEQYRSMAPLEQYLMKEQESEVALARTAAPPSISNDAEILVLTSRGYKAAVKGKNGFVCLVDRSWQSPIADPEFWNPKLRAPTCLNPQAARSVLPIQLKRTELVLAGVARSEIMTRIAAAIKTKELDSTQIGGMSYMMSKEQYLGDRFLNAMPHVMIYTPNTITADDWGANRPGSPVLGGPERVREGDRDPVVIFVVPVSHWSDGSLDVRSH